MPRAPSAHAINNALALFQRRWVLRIIWELRSGALTFRKMQEACGELSASVLNRRLRELRDALIVEHDGSSGGYQLTALGRDLVVAFEPLLRWSARWTKALS